MKIVGIFHLKRIMLLVLLAIAILLPNESFARENVRVGVYELAGFHAFNKDGHCEGYDVDYLNRIANITSWNYEYVKAASWAEAIRMLENKEIDLLAPAQITPERIGKFSFSVFPIGKVYGAILAPESNETVYEDFAAFNNMTFGIEVGNSYAKIFSDYAKQHGFTPHIKFYPNHSALVNAMQLGDVSAIVANVMRADSHMRLLGKAGTAQFYYMYRKDDVELGEALNKALDQIEIAEPHYQTELTHSYFPIYAEDPFTKAELDYGSKLPVIRVAVHKNNVPYSYVNPDTGKAEGIVIDYLRQSGNLAGIKYEFIPMEGVIDDDIMAKNDLQLIVETGIAPLDKNINKGAFSSNFLNSQQLIVIDPKVKFGLDKKICLAIQDYHDPDNKNLMLRFPNFTWLKCDTLEECFAAVQDGSADGCLVNQYSANWFLSMPKYEGMQIVATGFLPQTFAMRMGMDNGSVNPHTVMFIGLINKSLNQLSATQEQELIIKHTTAQPYQLTWRDVLYRYRVTIFILAVMILAILAVIVAYARDRDLKASTDSLTGLYNRKYAKQLISRILSSGNYASGALIIMDVDHFKSVNDTLGHQAGDRVIIDTAKILLSWCRSTDIVCRLGGDEFLIFLPYNKDGFLEEKLDKLTKKMERNVEEGGNMVKVTSSLGVAIVPKNGQTADALYKAADKALYQAKEAGRNQWKFAES